MATIQQLKDISAILRRDSIISTTEAGSGHTSTCLSSAELISAIFFSEMKFDTKNKDNPDNDEFILSKGHAAPIIYSALKRAGCIKTNLKTLRKQTSPLEGHPIPKSLPWIKVATGSLGQGLSVGLGMALASKLQNRRFRVFVLLGDSEIAEGSIYEAAELAPYHHLNNLVAIVDANRLGQTGQTLVGHDLEKYKKRFEAFGWNSVIIDGHSIPQILKALELARTSDKPTAIIAKTFKGRGVSLMEDKNGWHGKVIPKTYLNDALNEIPNPKMPKIKIQKPEKRKYKPKKTIYSPPFLNLNEPITTREAYGKALAQLAKSDDNVICVDADVANSTYTREVRSAKPFQFIEAYIAEQNMIGIALGLSKKGINTFSATFGAFLTRAHDQLRMSAISSANMTICGSHGGVSIGPDGASQMGLNDIAMFRGLPNSIILYPSDAVSTVKLTNLAYKLNQKLTNPSIKYIRTTRPKTPILYKPSTEFPLGQFKILKQSKSDKATLIGAGITTHEALKAHNYLKSKHKNTAVIDLYCIKPLNINKLIKFIEQHGNHIILAEDHYKAGGIGELIATSLANTNIKFTHLHVKGIPHTATGTQLLRAQNIDARAFARAVN